MEKKSRAGFSLNALLLTMVLPLIVALLISNLVSGYRQSEIMLQDEKVYFDGERATSAQGTIAGSTKLLPDIVKTLGKKGMFNPQYVENPYKYHKINLDGKLEWDEDFNIVSIS